MEGPTVYPHAGLEDWIRKNQLRPGRKKFIRIPVVVRFGDEHRLAVREAFLGVMKKKRTDEPLWLTLDDTRLGVSLMDHLQSKCPRERPRAIQSYPAMIYCHIWLEGTIEPSSDIPVMHYKKKKKNFIFVIRKVGECFDPQDFPASKLKIFVER